MIDLMMTWWDEKVNDLVTTWWDEVGPKLALGLI